jgi:uncharacterized protein
MNSKRIVFLIVILVSPLFLFGDTEDFLTALREGEIETARYFLESGISPNSTSTYGNFTALATAIRGGDPEIVKLLLEAGADVDAPSGFLNSSPLIDACSLRPPRPEIVTILLDAGAEVNYRDGINQSTALMAVKDPEIASMLIEAGAEVNHADSYGMTALSWAAADGYREVIPLFLEAGAGVTFEINRVMLAAYRGNGDELNALIKNGADIDTADAEGWTPLAVAAEYGSAGMVRLLLEAGADPDCRYTGWIPQLPPHEEFTPLMGAAKHNHSEAAELLLEYGAAVDAQDFYYTTALFHAIRADSAETVRVLLEGGAALERSFQGRKPLTDAVRLRHGDTVRVLLEAGADREEALQYAEEQGLDEMIELLTAGG